MWKNIPGFPLYQASADGQIRSLRKAEPKILKSRVQANGYMTVALNSRPESVHRLVCLAFHGLPPEGAPWALHKNDEKHDNRESNLYWGSPGQNKKDAIKHGKVASGEEHGMSKLKSADIAIIKERYKPRCRKNGAMALAKQFGVHRTTIENVISGRNWT